jgi:hypothetical protein
VRHGIAPNVQEPAAPIAQGWSRFELLAEDGETVYYVTICPDCPTEAELPYIRFDEGAAPHEGWKLPSIRRYVGDRPFAGLTTTSAWRPTAGPKGGALQRSCSTSAPTAD